MAAFATPAESQEPAQKGFQELGWQRRWGLPGLFLQLLEVYVRLEAKSYLPSMLVQFSAIYAPEEQEWGRPGAKYQMVGFHDGRRGTKFSLFRLDLPEHQGGVKSDRILSGDFHEHLHPPNLNLSEAPQPSGPPTPASNLVKRGSLGLGPGNFLRGLSEW